MQGNSLLESDQILLRPIEPEDLELLYRVENDGTVWTSCNTTMPYSKFFLKKYLESMQGDIFSDKQLRLVIEQKANYQPIGIIDLYDMVPLHQRAEIGIIILEEFRSLGYGKEAIFLLLEYAFSHLFLHQIYAYVAVSNTQSVHLFKSCGFEEVAQLKDWIFTQDGFEDVLLLQKVAKD
ncbi:GCN5-related N-acetyltransferase [Bacteroides coprosuis DSM 18011]|uniref:GCN5-related N-acetyltransferase n=1 Tax=Bacteroides coprosuis DSM 18011 TaxID=679937 RepID=F3ZU16_9BACE|nr:MULTISPECIES: GNAT family N-acetyltransferase [Bacteroides]EGJ71117.1 GCN5-related N-acetyltransferase [Bacteroides coprosuis DSM 18011]HJD91307.1 GNAT family N-acetyltransferase [Bacteroides coprosuis]